MANSIPIIGWLLEIIAAISLSVPFWLCWTYFEIGKKYFLFLPENYHEIPFWESVALFIVISILKGVLTPKLADVSHKVEKAA